MKLTINILSVIALVLMILLLIILIVLAIRALKSLKEFDKVVNDLKKKLDSVGFIFKGMDNISTGFSMVSSRLFDGTMQVLENLLNFLNRKTKNRFNKFDKDIDEEFMEQVPDEDEI